jgi:SAM-dependent methyltransferase
MLLLMNNYEFCAEYAAKKLVHGGKMLDYGCGDGTIVNLARAKGVDAYGCDVFYEGGDYSTQIKPDEFGKTIFRMENETIPFGADVFDLVISNQVLEHVQNLDHVLSEISRVLKPGGSVLSLFPDRGVWREGHCGVPLLHWFPKRSRTRVYYAEAFRLAGFGYFTSGKPPRLWAEDICKWLDDWTFYRPYDEIRELFERHFSGLHHLEAEWLVQRVGNKSKLLPKAVRSMVARKLGHLTFEVQKPEHGSMAT